MVLIKKELQIYIWECKAGSDVSTANIVLCRNITLKLSEVTWQEDDTDIKKIYLSQI